MLLSSWLNLTTTSSNTSSAWRAMHCTTWTTSSQFSSVTWSSNFTKAWALLKNLMQIMQVTPWWRSRSRAAHPPPWDDTCAKLAHLEALRLIFQETRWLASYLTIILTSTTMKRFKWWLKRSLDHVSSNQTPYSPSMSTWTGSGTVDWTIYQTREGSRLWAMTRNIVKLSASWTKNSFL